MRAEKYLVLEEIVGVEVRTVGNSTRAVRKRLVDGIMMSRVYERSRELRGL